MAADPGRSRPAVGSRETRIALNETRFREINERLANSLRDIQNRPQLLEFVCECGERSCHEHVHLTLAEYEAVRRDSRHFAIVPGHSSPGVERVVGGSDRYEVVEKIGEGARIADARDH